MKKWNVLLLSALALCVSLLPALAADAPAVLGILEIRGLDSMATSAFELSKVAGSPQPREMITLGMHKLLGTMPGMGIQPNGTVRALWFDNGTDKGGEALLLPVENEGATYLNGLGEAGWKNEAETADDIQHYVAPAGTSGTIWKEIYFLKRGSTLVAGPSADDVRKADAAMPTLPPILPVEGDVGLQIRPAALIAAFGPQIAEQMDQAFQTKPGTPPEAAAMGKLYGKGYLAVAKQLEGFTLGLGVADGNLNIHSRLAPVAGTTLARWLASVKSPAAEASVVNLPGALLAETAHLGDLSLLAPAYFRYLEELMKAMPQELGTEALKTYMDNAKTCWTQMGGDIGVALMPPTQGHPLRLAEYLSLKDAAGLRTLIGNMIQSANDLLKTMSAEYGKAMPFSLALTQGEPREYREIPVDTLAYALELGEPIASLWPQGLPTQLDLEMAWVPGGLIVSSGGNEMTEALVDRALDHTATPVSALPSWQAFFPMPETDLVDLAHVALFDTIRSYAGLVDSFTGGSNVDAIPAGAGNLDSASYLAMGGLMTRIRFSLADIAAIGQKAKEAREKARAAYQQEMQSQMEMMDAEDGTSAPMDDVEFEEWTADEPDLDEAPAPTIPAPAPAPAPEVAQ